MAKDGKREKINVKTKEDIWDYIYELWLEAKDYTKGDRQKTLIAVFEQLPFFCYNGNLLDEDLQKDIEKYMYCKDTNTPVYNGCYGETPKIWIQKHYAIKNALSARDAIYKNKLMESNGNK